MQLGHSLLLYFYLFNQLWITTSSSLLFYHTFLWLEKISYQLHLALRKISAFLFLSFRLELLIFELSINEFEVFCLWLNKVIKEKLLFWCEINYFRYPIRKMIRILVVNWLSLNTFEQFNLTPICLKVYFMRSIACMFV